MLIERIDAMLAAKIRSSPCHTNRASTLGHPCERFLVFERTRFEEKLLPTVALQYKFDDGGLHEGDVIRKLEDAGAKPFERQRDYLWRAFQISGHVDCKIVIEEWMIQAAPPEIAPLLVVGRTIPTDIKSCSRFSWDKLNTLADMYTSPLAYVQCYPGQVMLYNLFAEEKVGLMILKNKDTGQLKEIWVPLDFDVAEALVKKAERINACVANQHVPLPIPWTEAICGRCPYGPICLNEVKRTTTALADDPDLEKQLIQRDALREPHRTYEAIDDTIKEKFLRTDLPRVIVGGYVLTRHESERNGKTVTRVKIDKLAMKGVDTDE